MSTNEFISALKAKVMCYSTGASTEYVSCISYNHLGMVISEAKLGNDLQYFGIDVIYIVVLNALK